MNEQVETEPQDGARGKPARALGLYFFSALEDESDDAAAYDLLLDAARAADVNGLDFVWVPERHFTRFGGGHPNPAVLAAAIAVVTSKLRIRAGSVVLPLHDPLRVAEEWAVVDNLSHGRAEISSATGWSPRDFVLAPAAYAGRAALAAENFAIVQQLWSGGEISREGPDGTEYRVRTYPRPVQPVLPHWITASGNPATFERAGEVGAALFSSYGLLPPGELAERISLYRRSFAAHHGGPGRVCLMVHAGIGDSGAEMRSLAREPLRRYLAAYLGQQDSAADPVVAAKRLDFAVHRYLHGRSLIGDRAEAVQVLAGIFETGADEVACLVDFGLPRDSVLNTVAELADLRAKFASDASDVGAVRRRDAITDTDPECRTGASTAKVVSVMTAENEITADTIAGLLREQHPDLAHLPLKFGARGWDNQLWRLGDDLAVRLPWATADSAELLLKEHALLPTMAPRLPLPIPVPQRLGRPTERFPNPWIVTTWVAGEPADCAPATRGAEAADTLAAFLTALHRPAPHDAPAGRNSRGGLLADVDGGVAYSLKEATDRGLIPDPKVLQEVWNDALAAPAWTGPAQWLHADLHPANVLTRDGDFCGVIDFGDVCAGDPACDLAACWALLPEGTIDRFYAGYSPYADPATRRRARGWALWKALACLLIGDNGVHGRPGGKATWGPPAADTLRRLTATRPGLVHPE